MDEYLYMLFTCDEDKNKITTKEEGIFTEDRIREVLKKCIEIEYRGIKYDQDIKTIDTWKISDISHNLSGGFILRHKLNDWKL